VEKVEFVVIGAGLSGLSAAMVLGQAGAEVLVVERGDYPGSKNVTGGRLYLEPVRPFLPNIWDNAPLERAVVKERLTMMAPNASATIELDSDRFRQPPYPSYTLLHATFDRWFSDQATERGALVIPGYKVDDLIIENGKISGIVSSGDEIRANAVIAADGALSFMAEKAGLRKQLPTKNYAVAVKEVIELPSQVIEERFGLQKNEGAAHLFLGSSTIGLHGGGFLYTNHESLSLGLVIGIHDFMEKNDSEGTNGSSNSSPHDLLETFKARSEIQSLIAGGHSVEYAAHIIPEGGFKAIPQLVTDGMILVGDAAGLTLNMGMTVRGMDFAIASGVMAARTLLRARQEDDFTRASLAHYERQLKESFVWQDLKTFQYMPDFLTNSRLYENYPSVACDLLEQLFSIGAKPKEKLSKTLLRLFRDKLLHVDVLRDLLMLRKI
jgi:electron transfer flavoprotein-quinone oxidoreductase